MCSPLPRLSSPFQRFLLRQEDAGLARSVSTPLASPQSNVCWHAPPGCLQTLMDVLAGRKTGGVITGDIRVNG